jgi:hypothetical protein
MVDENEDIEFDDQGDDSGEDDDLPEAPRDPLCEEERILRPVGVKLSYKRRWRRNDPPPRESFIDPNVIESVRLPFNPTDWWHLTTREGRDYIGPCCGTSGAMQDIICEAYRDSGWIKSDALLELGGLGETHDGYEDWKEPLSLDDLRAKANLEAWTEHDRWGIIGIVYRALRPKLEASLTWHKLRGPGRFRPPSEKHTIHVLRQGLTLLSWGDIITRENDGGQSHANRHLLIARVLPAAKLLVKQLAEFQPFNGFAIVGEDDKDIVIDNRLGACVYNTVEDAQKIIDLSRKVEKDLAEDNPEHADAKPFAALIRPVRVTVEDGLTFTDGENHDDREQQPNG